MWSLIICDNHCSRQSNSSTNHWRICISEWNRDTWQFIKTNKWDFPHFHICNDLTIFLCGYAIYLTFIAHVQLIMLCNRLLTPNINKEKDYFLKGRFHLKWKSCQLLTPMSWGKIRFASHVLFKKKILLWKNSMMEESDMRESTFWQNFHFWSNCPFNSNKTALADI